MNPRLIRAWIVKGAVIAILLSAGWLFHRVTLRPDPDRLRSWAEEALVEIFGKGVRHGDVSVDVLEGVRIQDLRVEVPGRPTPVLSAERVDVRHDVLALSAGVLRLRSIAIRAPKVSTRENEAGEVVPDFQFTLPKADGRASPPSVLVERGTLRFVAAEKSETFRSGAVIELDDFHVTALPDGKGGLEIAGGFDVNGLGFKPEDKTIALSGSAKPLEGTLALEATWPRVYLTPELLAAFSDTVRKRIEEQRLEEGPHRATIRLRRDPTVEEGRLRVVPELHVTVRPDAITAPLAKTVDATTREQLAELLGKIDLTVEIKGKKIEVRDLTSQLAGGEVRAKGTLEDDGQTLDLVIEAKGVHLDDPAFTRALGAVGKQVADEFRLGGRADATFHLKRVKGGPLAWDAVVDLVDATVAYVGKMDPVKRTPSGRPLYYGFPYAAEHVFGRVRISDGSVVVEGLEGRHGLATIHVRSNAETSRDGLETGYVRWKDGPASLRMTIEAKNIPVDADILEAVERSEIAGFLDTYRLHGVVDRVLVELVQEQPRDRDPLVEIELETEGETLAFAPFPVPISDVKGRLLLSRPPIGTDRRGREIEVAAVGNASGGVVGFKADLVESERRGRIQIKVANATIGPEVNAAVETGEAGKGGLGSVWRLLHPFGKADVAIDLPAYEDPGPPTYEVTLKGAGVHLRPEGKGGGARIEDIAGTVRVTGAKEGDPLGDRIEIVGAKGRWIDAPITVSGTMVGGTEGDWDLSIEGTRIAITDGLLDVMALASEDGRLFPKGLSVDPGGRLDLFLRLQRTRPPRGDGNLHATVRARNLDVVARLGDLPVRLRGGLEPAGDDVRLVDVTAEGDGLSLSFSDAVVGPRGFRGQGRAKLTGLTVTKPVLELLPESARGTVADLFKDRVLDSDEFLFEADEAGGMVFRGTLASRPRSDGVAPGTAPFGRFTLSPLSISGADAPGGRSLSGLVLLEGVTLDLGVRVEEIRGEARIEALSLGDTPSGRGSLAVAAARIGGIALTDVHAPIEWRESVLTAAPIVATAYTGRVEAAVTVHTKAPEAFEGTATITGVQLQDLLRDLASGGAETHGVLDARVEFQSRGGGVREVTAAGTASVHHGDLGELPVVATIPALLSRMVPSLQRPRFHSATASFVVENGTVRVERVTMAGPLFRMSGFGTVPFTDGNPQGIAKGEVDFTFSPQFIKSFLLPGVLQIPLVGDALGLLREDPLYVVRVRGPLSSAKPEVVAFPFFRPQRAQPPYRDSPSEARTTPPDPAPSYR